MGVLRCQALSLILLGKYRPFRAARLWCGVWAMVSLREGFSGYRTLSSLVNSGRQCLICIPATLESLVWSELDWGTGKETPGV